MTDKAQVTREELVAMREVARKAALAALMRQGLPVVEAQDLAAKVAKDLYPLPAPEPQQAQGPSGKEYWLHAATHDPRDYRLEMAGGYYLYVPDRDRATVANLLCPFEDVVRATLNELGIRKVGGEEWVWQLGPESEWRGLSGAITLLLPKILKRLEAR